MAFLFEDTFIVKEKDSGGKKFDKVSRLICTGENHDVLLHLDINTEIYPVEAGQKFTLALAKTLNLDNSPMEDSFDQSERPTLADNYDYVMHGKVFKWIGVEDKDSPQQQKVAVIVSFGGLLMMLKGDPRSLKNVVCTLNQYSTNECTKEKSGEIRAAY